MRVSVPSLRTIVVGTLVLGLVLMTVFFESNAVSILGQSGDGGDEGTFGGADDMSAIGLDGGGGGGGCFHPYIEEDIEPIVCLQNGYATLVLTVKNEGTSTEMFNLVFTKEFQEEAIQVGCDSGGQHPCIEELQPKGEVGDSHELTIWILGDMGCTVDGGIVSIEEYNVDTMFSHYCPEFNSIYGRFRVYCEDFCPEAGDPVCGNAALEQGETCEVQASGDWGDCRPASGNDGCTKCGDGVTQEDSGETCEVQASGDWGACRPVSDAGGCTLCGDGVVQGDAGETCDVLATGWGDCRSSGGAGVQCTKCGDGVIQADSGEMCDGNALGECQSCESDCRCQASGGLPPLPASVASSVPSSVSSSVVGCENDEDCGTSGTIGCCRENRCLVIDCIGVMRQVGCACVQLEASSVSSSLHGAAPSRSSQPSDDASSRSRALDSSRSAVHSSVSQSSQQSVSSSLPSGVCCVNNLCALGRCQEPFGSMSLCEEKCGGSASSASVASSKLSAPKLPASSVPSLPSPPPPPPSPPLPPPQQEEPYCGDGVVQRSRALCPKPSWQSCSVQTACEPVYHLTEYYDVIGTGEPIIIRQPGLDGMRDLTVSTCYNVDRDRMQPGGAWNNSILHKEFAGPGPNSCTFSYMYEPGTLYPGCYTQEVLQMDPIPESTPGQYDRWMHGGGVYRADGGSQLFMNGQSVSITDKFGFSPFVGGIFKDDFSPLYVGGRRSPGSGRVGIFPGRIADVRVYPCALPSGQLADLAACCPTDRCLDDLPEECDEGSKNSNEPGAKCRMNCKKAGCGDGIVDPGEECDSTNRLECTRDCRKIHQGPPPPPASEPAIPPASAASSIASSVRSVGEQLCEPVYHFDDVTRRTVVVENAGFDGYNAMTLMTCIPRTGEQLKYTDARFVMGSTSLLPNDWGCGRSYEWSLNVLRTQSPDLRMFGFAADCGPMDYFTKTIQTIPGDPRWMHVATTFAEGQARTYVDAEELQLQTTMPQFNPRPHTIPSNEGPFRFGGTMFRDLPNDEFTNIADVRVYPCLLPKSKIQEIAATCGQWGAPQGSSRQSSSFIPVLLSSSQNSEASVASSRDSGASQESASSEGSDASQKSSTTIIVDNPPFSSLSSDVSGQQRSSTIAAQSSERTGRALCGNARLDPGEHCDIGHNYCLSGRMCEFATCTCVPLGQNPDCGNGVLNDEEQCDGALGRCAEGRVCDNTCTCVWDESSSSEGADSIGPQLPGGPVDVADEEQLLEFVDSIQSFILGGFEEGLPVMPSSLPHMRTLRRTGRMTIADFSAFAAEISRLQSAQSLHSPVEPIRPQYFVLPSHDRKKPEYIVQLAGQFFTVTDDNAVAPVLKTDPLLLEIADASRQRTLRPAAPIEKQLYFPMAQATPIPIAQIQAQLQPLALSQPPAGDTGPGAAVMIATGVGAGLAYMRRRGSRRSK